MKDYTVNPERLANCRKKMGITKQEAAKRMMMGQPTYLRYESGERNPSIHILRSIAEVLNTSIAYLTDQTDDPAPDSYMVKAADEPELFNIIKEYRKR